MPRNSFLASLLKLPPTRTPATFFFKVLNDFFKVPHGHIQAPLGHLKGHQSDMPPLLILVAAMGKGKQINESN